MTKQEHTTDLDINEEELVAEMRELTAELNTPPTLPEKMASFQRAAVSLRQQIEEDRLDIEHKYRLGLENAKVEYERAVLEKTTQLRSAYEDMCAMLGRTYENALQQNERLAVRLPR